MNPADIDAATIAERRHLAVAGAGETIAAAIADTARLCALLALSGRQFGVLIRAIERAAARPMIDINIGGDGRPDAGVWRAAADRLVDDGGGR
jgi:hypothetical protein